jgi:hypothetical protein
MTSAGTSTQASAIGMAASAARRGPRITSQAAKKIGVILMAVAATIAAAARTSCPSREALTPSSTSTKMIPFTCTWWKLSRKNWALSSTASASGTAEGLRSANVRATMSRVRKTAAIQSPRLRKETSTAATGSGNRASGVKTSAAKGGYLRGLAPGR